MTADCFIPLNLTGNDVELPKKFTFPFYYEPHKLSLIAAEKLQQHLLSLKDLDHNFGLDSSKSGLVIGKMFGVLVVQNKAKELGYLAAFSGKLGNQNIHSGFVPPIFDMLEEGSFFKKGEAILNQINLEIEQLEKSEEYISAKKRLEEVEGKAEQEINTSKHELKEAKSKRKQERENTKNNCSEEVYNKLHTEHKEESLKQQYFHKKLIEDWKSKVLLAKAEVDSIYYTIEKLKQERKLKSKRIQEQLFKEYSFFNANKEIKNLLDIFLEEIPPSGAGDCAAPKLLNYAFQHDLKPICMAEFWWGTSPLSEIRKHKQFYPSCNSKCKPILGHMLLGLDVDKNPIDQQHSSNKEIEIIYEDEVLAVINKPAEFLSVPGKTVSDSVYTRMHEKYPDVEGPIIVHRLDMSTSGIMLIAKTKKTHKFLQKQFLQRTVKKRYVALLDGLLNEKNGLIDLPLRVDLDDRPRQLVCYEYGKPAQTKWQTISVTNNQTKVYFYPITGRTHQLRVHASHQLGLNTPIVGDDLYGTKQQRLHLHAESITFIHPKTKKELSFSVKEEF